MSLLQTVKSAMGNLIWHRLWQCSTSTFENSRGCTSAPGLAGIKGNDRIDRISGEVKERERERERPPQVVRV